MPTKEASEQFVYEFSHWDKDYSRITENLIINPVFNEQLRSYYVYFMADTDVIYDTQSVFYGSNATLPLGIPFKEGTDLVGYKFVGWQTNYQNIQDDTYVYANYTNVEPGIFTVTFMDGDTVLKTEMVHYGKAATAPIINYDNHPT